MRDPVTDIEYPEAWVQRCGDEASLDLVRGGLAVLTSNGSVLRRGFTTGTTAATAVAAAILSHEKGVQGSLRIRLACGIEADVPVTAESGVASAKKYPGDYPDDVTAGLEFRAMLLGLNDSIVIDFSKGIGRLERETSRYRRGDPSVSPTAMACIMENARAACAQIGERGAWVRLEAVQGVEVAKRTLNERMGTVGGISILGSTGLVEPWDDHLTEDMLERVRRSQRVVITTGRVGLAHSRRLFPEHEVVLVGVNMLEALQAAPGQVMLCGLPALILKFIDPDVLAPTQYRTVDELMASDQGLIVLEKKLDRFKQRFPRAGITIVSREGKILGERR